MLIVFCGLPGSGKSYLASLLAAKLNLAYLSTDIIRKDKVTANTYAFSNKQSVYDEMLSLAVQFLIQGNDVIVDGTFYKESIRLKFQKNIQILGYEMKFIHVFADEATIKKRLVKKRKYSDADYKVYQKIKKSFEPLKCPHLSINTGIERDVDSLDKILSYLKK